MLCLSFTDLVVDIFSHKILSSEIARVFDYFVHGSNSRAKKRASHSRYSVKIC
jgi:hypothetical protein